MNQNIDIEQISAEELRTLDAIRQRKECIWQNVCNKSNIGSRPSAPAKVVKMSVAHTFSWLGAAAAIAALVVVGSMLFSNANRINHISDCPEMFVANSDRAFGLLEDGSSVRLAQGTTIGYDLSGNERVVVLDGQASFDVKRDESRPFIIHLEGRESQVEVLGTSFIVENLNDRERFGVRVKSGNVRVKSPFGTADLKYGERVIIDNGEFVKSDCSTNAVADWDANKLDLKGASLRESVDEILLLYPQIKSVKESPKGLIDQMKDIYVTSKFDNEPLDKVLSELSLHFGIKMEYVDGSLTLTR